MMRPTANAAAGLLAVLATLALAACSTSLSGQANGPHPANAPYQRVLVVLPQASAGGRDTAERRFVQQLGGGTTRVYASIMVAEKLADAPRTDAEIDAMAAEIGADALLIIEATDSSNKLGKTQKEKYFEDGLDDGRKLDDDSWATRSTVDPEYDVPDVKVTVDVLITLHDVADDRRTVYVIEARSKYKDKGGNMNFTLADNIAEPTAAELRRKGFIE